jgi:hypothetical protein
VLVKANDEEFAPVAAMLEMLKGDPPVLVSVICCVVLVDPTWTVPKERLLLDSETAGGVALVPLKAIDSGDPLALSVMVMAAA